MNNTNTRETAANTGKNKIALLDVLDSYHAGLRIMIKKSKILCPLRTKSILWEGAFIINLIKELQDFLKTKMKQVDDPTFGTYCICTACDRSKEYDCWGKTAEFCAKKGLDWQTFTEVLNSFSGFAYDIRSDADVLNRLQVKGESGNISKGGESEGQAK